MSTASFELGARAYGKQRVRAITLQPGSSEGEVADLTLSILLRGGVEECFEAGRNDRTVTSDAQRNLAFAVLERVYPAAVEEVAITIAQELRRQYPHFPAAEVQVVGVTWQRTGSTFVRQSPVRHRATATALDGEVQARSGLDGLDLLVTGGSRFVGFLVDEYTTNEPALDRPLSGVLSAEWSYGAGQRPDWAQVRREVHQSLLSTFSAAPSESVQHLLALMGRAALEQAPRVTEISLRMESTSLAATAFGTGGGARTFAVTTSPGAVTELTVHRRAP